MFSLTHPQHNVEAFRPLARLEQYDRPNTAFKWWTECKALHALMPSIDVSQYTPDLPSDDSDSDSIALQDTRFPPSPASPHATKPLLHSTPSPITGSSHSRRRAQIQPPHGWEPVAGYISTVRDPNSQDGEWHCPVVGCRRYLGGLEVPFTSKSSMKRHWMSVSTRALEDYERSGVY